MLTITLAHIVSTAIGALGVLALIVLGASALLVAVDPDLASRPSAIRKA